jgi:hypothetical protein
MDVRLKQCTFTSIVENARLKRKEISELPEHLPSDDPSGTRCRIG